MNQYRAYCESCGHSWRFFADSEPDFAECLNCGADAWQVELIGVRFEP